jgi:hypothetical protein
LLRNSARHKAADDDDGLAGIHGILRPTSKSNQTK